MHELWQYIGWVFGAIISAVTIAKFLFYTKSEVNQLFTNLKAESDKKDEMLLEKVTETQNEIKDNLVKTREEIFKNILDNERNTNKITQEIYDRLSQNKQVFDDYNKNMLEIISQVKQDDKQISNEFIKLLSEVKDELKNDYISRYNDLIKMINTKVSTSDFDRLEAKFDKVTETITELRTIIQMQKENHEI